MRVTSSNVSMTSAYTIRQDVVVEDSTRVWGRPGSQASTPLEAPRPVDPLEDSRQAPTRDFQHRPGAEFVALARGGVAAFAAVAGEARGVQGRPQPRAEGPVGPPPGPGRRVGPRRRGEDEGNAEEELEKSGDHQTAQRARILRKMFGVDTYSVASFGRELEEAHEEGAEGAAQVQQAQQGPRQGWGIEIRHAEYRLEYESMQFQAEGSVTTADGRAIDFSTALSRDRLEVEASETVIRAGDPPPTDPLVLDTTGTGVALSEQRFDFDLDADGDLEQVPGLASGAFLANDVNGNGTIDDGSELFGPTSGNGFAELATNDADNNGWIDEADPIWGQLGLFSGVGFAGLTDSGIGAIYLGNTATPFTEQASDGSTLGLMRSTGVYLRENGSAGLVHQIDVVA